jgi:hypothetical protein
MMYYILTSDNSIDWKHRVAIRDLERAIHFAEDLSVRNPGMWVKIRGGIFAKDFVAGPAN